MSVVPFPADAELAQRFEERRAAVGVAVESALEDLLASRRRNPRTAATVAAADVARLVTKHDLASDRELALLALPLAARLARPPISDYHVGVVGLDAGGDLVLGANLEFPGADLQSTIHAEGFASLRARARGTTLSVIALTEAHPCAHCRQTLAESIAADDLELIDPHGHALRLGDLYPWPFMPAALGVRSDDPTREAWPGLVVAGTGPAGRELPPDVAKSLLNAARRAHAPYSRSPSAAALRLRDRRVLVAGCVESVSFNPTISAMQAALVELAAVGGDRSDVEAAWLARMPGGQVDPVPGAQALLAAVAPSAHLTVVDLVSEGRAE